MVRVTHINATCPAFEGTKPLLYLRGRKGKHKGWDEKRKEEEERGGKGKEERRPGD